MQSAIAKKEQTFIETNKYLISVPLLCGANSKVTFTKTDINVTTKQTSNNKAKCRYRHKHMANTV